MIVDASVAFKWLAPEEGSAAAFDLIGGDVLAAPTLLLIEVGNALWKKAQRDQIQSTVSFAEELESLAGLLMIRDEQPVIARALTIARSLRHPIYDCVYLALAEAEDAELVTADARFAAAVDGSEWRNRVRLLG